MNMRQVTAYGILIASFVTTISSAQPASDHVGIYFDETGTANGVHVSGPGMVHAYVVVTGCTLSNHMVYFWGGVQMDASYSIQLRGDGANAHSLLPDANGVVGLAVTFGTPLEISDAVTVADLFIEVVSDEVIGIWCESNDSPGGWAYEMQGAGAEPWEVVRLWQSTDPGSAPGPLWPWFAASINGAPPVAEGGTTWGGLKCRYR